MMSKGQEEAAGEGERVLTDVELETISLQEGPSTLIEMRRLTWQLEMLTDEHGQVSYMQMRRERDSAAANQRLAEIANKREKVVERLVELAVWLRQ